MARLYWRFRVFGRLGGLTREFAGVFEGFILGRGNIDVVFGWDGDLV
jgi:hypothetical protein